MYSRVSGLRLSSAGITGVRRHAQPPWPPLPCSGRLVPRLPTPTEVGVGCFGWLPAELMAHLFGLHRSSQDPAWEGRLLLGPQDTRRRVVGRWPVPTIPKRLMGQEKALCPQDFVSLTSAGEPRLSLQGYCSQWASSVPQPIDFNNHSGIYRPGTDIAVQDAKAMP